MIRFPVLHHTAMRVRPTKLKLAIGAFELLGCKNTYMPASANWVILSQGDGRLNIQLIESNKLSVKGDNKLKSHLGFISKTPASDIAKVKKWAVKNKITFKQGHWSDLELWFDLPNIYVDFVVEIMHESVLEE